ncbi:response regulator transcription factor [Paenibacillus lautus]|jgi:DNA-binding response OmpR family regulator|uniref:DNA-binding response regulator n=1 Tax=Paenibacillus lautus TaxID=1401 RepID=A0A385TVJ5_PAELA|nr:response regulator transcription factor [Paenibacillus lautus]AYB47483.1 DNA-binding response regulator [Paenibacillus lautus]MCI1773034.1 response regulator transcription factor [Paenibacillus lautus]VTR49710.1 phosphate regulon transcriptional regulatory protein [Actinobacillus pleuropneumoniae]
MYTILIVEDDERIADKLRSAISKYDFNVRITEDFNRVMDIFAETKPDLVLLDVNLPKYDGFYWCRQIRTQSHCPIIFISARDSGMDQIMALENGADDYITKPFDMELVLAKVRSHLRRAVGAYASGQEEEHTVESAGLLLYPERFLVTYGDRSAELTQKEAALLTMLMEKDGRVVSRERLLDLMWEDQHFIDDNTLNVYITRVRRKLRELGAGDLIETVRGAGYRFMTGKETI